MEKLLIQDICLSWGKKERNPACARRRTEFPVAYSLDHVPGILHGEVLVNCLNFMQGGTVFQPLNREAYCYQFYPSVKDLNLTNLFIQSEPHGCKVVFFYDERRSGQPVRRGHNKDYDNADSWLYRHDILNENAFSLKKHSTYRYPCCPFCQNSTVQSAYHQAESIPGSL